MARHQCNLMLRFREIIDIVTSVLHTIKPLSMIRYSRIVYLIIIVLLIPIVPFALIGELPGERWLMANDENALLFGLTGTALLTLDVLLPIPSSILGTLMAARLGFGAGFFCVWTGLMLGNLIGYTTGRLLLYRLATQLPETPTQFALFLSRPVPVFAEAVTFAAGAGKMKISDFCIVCAAGNAIYAVVLAGNGAHFIPEAMVGPGLILPMSLPVITWWLWRRLKNKN